MSTGEGLVPPPPPESNGSDEATSGEERSFTQVDVDLAASKREVEVLREALDTVGDLARGGQEVAKTVAEEARKAQEAQAAAGSSAPPTPTPTPAKSAAELALDRQEQRKVKGRKEWEHDNPFEDSFWQGTSYDRAGDDFKATDFPTQLDNEIAALKSVADALASDPSTLPTNLGELDNINPGKKQPSIRTQRYADLVDSGTTEEQIIALSYDVMDALAQRAGEAQLLSIEGHAVQEAGRLKEAEAKKMWAQCTELNAKIGSDVLLKKGHSARQAFNGLNSHLEGTDDEVKVAKSDYEANVTIKVREAFDKQAAHALKEGFKFTETHRDLNPKSESKQDDKRRKAKEQADDKPNDVFSGFWVSEPVEQQGESYKWSKNGKIPHIGAAVTAFVLEAYWRWGSEFDLNRGVENILARVASVYGAGKLAQAGASERHKNKAEQYKRKEHLQDQINKGRSPNRLPNNPTTAHEKMQVAYPNSLKPFDQAAFERAHNATRNVRLLSALCAFAVAVSLAGIGNEQQDAGAQEGIINVDDFGDNQPLSEEVIESAEPNFNESDTQFSPPEQLRLQELLDEGYSPGAARDIIIDNRGN